MYDRTASWWRTVVLQRHPSLQILLSRCKKTCWCATETQEIMILSFYFERKMKNVMQKWKFPLIVKYCICNIFFFFFFFFCNMLLCWIFGWIRQESFCLQQSHKYWFTSLCLATMVWKWKSLICENEWRVFRWVTGRIVSPVIRRAEWCI